VTAGLRYVESGRVSDHAGTLIAHAWLAREALSAPNHSHDLEAFDNRGRIHFHAPLLHHLRQVSVRDPVIAVPTNTNQDDPDWKATTAEHEPSWRPGGADPVNATVPSLEIDTVRRFPHYAPHDEYDAL